MTRAKAGDYPVLRETAIQRFAVNRGTISYDKLRDFVHTLHIESKVFEWFACFGVRREDEASSERWTAEEKTKGCRGKLSNNFREFIFKIFVCKFILMVSVIFFFVFWHKISTIMINSIQGVI